MPHTDDLLPLVRRLLAAYDRGNKHDLHTAIAELRAVAGLDEAPGNECGDAQTPAHSCAGNGYADRRGRDCVGGNQ